MPVVVALLVVLEELATESRDIERRGREVGRVAAVGRAHDPIGVDLEVGRGEQLGVGVEAGGRSCRRCRRVPLDRVLEAVPPIVSELPRSRIGPNGLGKTPVDLVGRRRRPASGRTGMSRRR